MKRISQTRIEWVFLGIIAVVCVVLSFLQYRWTGELSRAEPALLRAGLNEQLRRLALSFNEEIRENCTALLPDAREIKERGIVEAHKIHYERWASSHERMLFTRIGIAAPQQGTLKLFGIDGEGRIAPMEWPDAWAPLKAGMTARMNGAGRPPNAPPDSNLIEIPIFADPKVPSTEIEWMIFELNTDYLRTTVLPHLSAEYLNPGSDAVYDVSISWANPRDGVVFSTRSDGSSVVTQADATAGLFSAEMGIPPAGGRGRFRDDRSMSRWTIAVRHRAGSLDAAVSRARTRNLIASLILVGLLGGTAWALAR